MKRMFKNLLTFALVVVIAFGSFVFVSAEGSRSNSLIYFEVPDFWGEFENIYCHIALYGGDAFANWHTEVTKCSKVGDNLYAYDVSKVCTLQKGEYYSVIFSSDKLNQTFDTILTAKCIGDTLYCDGNIVEEPTASRHNTAYWKNTFPIMVGDSNLDKKVSVQDATKIQKVIAFVDFMPVHWLFMLDTNGDTNVNIKDATEIQKWIAKLPSNDKIGVFEEEVTESTIATEFATNDQKATGITTSSAISTDPTESTIPASTSSDKGQEVTVPVESSVTTDPAESTAAEEPIPTTTAQGDEPDYAPYQKEVIDIFVAEGHNPYEDGMFYEVIYSYYGGSTADEAAPDYVLIWTSVGAVADEVFEVTIGDYVLTCPGHCAPYLPGYYIFIPSTNTLLTIEEAYHQKLEGLETVFEESPVFRPVEVDFKIIDEARINYYGSEETELYLLHHSSAEEALTSIFTTGFFEVPELNLPCDDKGFYYDKIYVASLNFLGGGGSTQTVDRITVADHTLTVYRTIISPEPQTPDMNYQYVLIELDASLLESISELKDVTVKYTI